MGVALLSLATVAETQNLEARLLPDPLFSFFCFLLPLFFLSSFFALPFLCSCLSMKQWSKEQTMAWAGLEDQAARAAQNSMGCSTASEYFI